MIFERDIGEYRAHGGIFIGSRNVCAEMQRDLHVFVCGHLAERLWHLKSTIDAERHPSEGRHAVDRSAAENDMAGIEMIDTRNQVDRCRFARAVRSYHTQNLAAAHGKTHVTQDGEAVELLADVLQR